MFNWDDIKEYVANLLQERFGLATAVAVTAASAVLLYLTGSGPRAIEYPIPLGQQSVEIEVKYTFLIFKLPVNVSAAYIFVFQY